VCRCRDVCFWIIQGKYSSKVFYTLYILYEYVPYIPIYTIQQQDDTSISFAYVSCYNLSHCIKAVTLYYLIFLHYSSLTDANDSLKPKRDRPFIVMVVFFSVISDITENYRYYIRE